MFLGLKLVLMLIISCRLCVWLVRLVIFEMLVIFLVLILFLIFLMIFLGLMRYGSLVIMRLVWWVVSCLMFIFVWVLNEL